MNNRHDNRRGGGGPRKEDRADIVDRGEDPTNIDTSPTSRALVPSSRRTSLFVADSALPRVAARLPVGMATADQIDSFRELRTRLLQMAHGVGLGYFTTLVVPMTADSGASFVARNLAAAFTLQDHQIATLVDCNLRHPTQHTALGARADDGGLFDFLEQPHAAIDQIVCPTGIAGLHLIPAGHRPSMAREYFSSPAMRMLMSALRQEACFVVLDGPPAVGSPDARILSALADFVILVVGYGRVSPERIAQAAAMFEASKFAGVVFNERT
jgi:Mrp family chromosome partitioning ATPase